VSPDLAYDVFIAEPIPQNVAETTPNGDRLMWSPLSSTMIHGEHDAVLVDPPFTLEQGRAVGDWIEMTNKNLTHIFVTHGHGDHWFTAGLIADRFNADVVATVGTIEQMHRNVAAREMVWDRIFPGQIPETIVTATPPQNDRIDLEGHHLVVVEVGHTDSDAAAVLDIPDLNLVVAGDAVYNGVHLYLAESAGAGRDHWRAAIDIVENLNPTRIVAGHKDKNLDDDAARTINQTRDYLDSTDELMPQCNTATALYRAMLKRYTDRLNPGVLWMSANALYR
jgi:glyoxylase-like metal-dependent hydrolase (beta-lactamase superfamily II)